MENSKEVQSNSAFLFEHYERSISFSESQTNEANGSVLDITIGFMEMQICINVYHGDHIKCKYMSWSKRDLNTLSLLEHEQM